MVWNNASKRDVLMTQSNLGRLEQVDLRSIWSTEDRDFTPWLAEENNLHLLGDTIGIELALEAQEESVGPFRADILCKDTANDSWVLIENQLERTDHAHQGQLLTYAGGLQAVTIVWISRRFTEEHRGALDWLNEITDDKFKFFGLEIEAWKIGDSTPAPKFNIVSKPNDWHREVARGASQLNRGELTETKKTQLQFWTDFRKYVDETGAEFKSVKPQPQHWLNLGIGKTGFFLSPIAILGQPGQSAKNNHELRVDLWMTEPSSYDALYELREEIEAELNRSLSWHDARGHRVSVRRDADFHDKDRWSEYIQWLVGELNDFHRCFGPRIKGL